jgi:hypothetical protein
MKKSIIFFSTTLLLYLFLSASIAKSQEQSDLQPELKNIIQDPKVAELIEKHIQFNENQPVIEGFRVQIFFDSGNNSMENASKVKSNFLNKYPDIPVYLLWQQPNYKVRVGDFRTKIEAQGFYSKIKSEYKNAFIVKDKIYFPAISQ